MVQRACRLGVCGKKGGIERLRVAPLPESVTVDMDEWGPVAARSYPGARRVQAVPRDDGEAAERARQEADYGRRGKGYVYGAFLVGTGKVYTDSNPCTRRI